MIATDSVREEVAPPGKTGGKNKVLRANGPKDLMDVVISKINAGRPKGPGARQIDFEVARSTVQILSKVRYVLKTGIEDYDAALGIGGLPFGRITELYGTDGSAKTALAQLCAMRVQKKEIYERITVPGQERAELRKIDEEVPVFTLFIDNEQSLDEDGKCKIDGTLLDVAVGRCDTVDQMFKMIDTAIDALDAAVMEINKQREKDRKPPLPVLIAIICDTIAATSSREEMTDKWDKQDYPRQAKQLREGFRIMTRKFNRRNVLGIFTNQVADKYDKEVRRGPKSSIAQDSDFNTFGGRALKFYASVRVFHTQVNTNYKLDKALRFPSGRTIQFTVTKNKLGKPWRSGKMVLLYEGGLSNIFSKLEMLLFLKLAEYGDREAGETGIRFKFRSVDIEPVTFTAETGERSRIPTMEGSLAGWPAFYEAHRVDFDRLWEYAMNLMQQEEVRPEGLEESEETIASEVDVDES